MTDDVFQYNSECARYPIDSTVHIYGSSAPTHCTPYTGYIPNIHDSSHFGFFPLCLANNLVFLYFLYSVSPCVVFAESPYIRNIKACQPTIRPCEKNAFGVCVACGSSILWLRAVVACWGGGVVR